jgi:hypothetical protein
MCRVSAETRFHFFFREYGLQCSAVCRTLLSFANMSTCISFPPWSFDEVSIGNVFQRRFERPHVTATFLTQPETRSLLNLLIPTSVKKCLATYRKVWVTLRLKVTTTWHVLQQSDETKNFTRSRLYSNKHFDRSFTYCIRTYYELSKFATCPHF